MIDHQIIIQFIFIKIYNQYMMLHRSKFLIQNSIKMEAPREAESQQVGTRQTYRSVKSPDQCVISYNFQHSNSMNFTHNLLIGMGFQQSLKKSRKQQPLNSSPPNKQKLFSIIPQPNKVFRNQAHSVNKAYNVTTLPKRNPHHMKKQQKKEMNPSHHIRSAQISDWQVLQERQLAHQTSNNDRTLQEKNIFEDKIVSQPPQLLNSPYGLMKQKGQNTKTPKNSSSKHSSLHNTSKKIERKSEVPNHSQSKFSQKNIQVAKSENMASNLLEQNNQGEQNELLEDNSLRLDHSNATLQKIDNKNIDQGDYSLNKSKNNDLKGRPNASTLTNFQKNKHNKFNKENNKQSPIKNKEVRAFKVNSPHRNSPSNSNKHSSSKNYLSTSKIKTNKSFKKSDIKTEQKQSSFHEYTKSKKQIQDEQLEQIQARVRKQQSNKFKKGYFKIRKNQQKQILPFQANIEPLFNNKNGNQIGVKSNQNIKVLNKKTEQQSEIIAKNNFSNHNYTNKSMVNKVESKIINNPGVNEGKSNNFNLKNSPRAVELPKNNLPNTAISQKQNNSTFKRMPSSNLNSISTNQKIKREHAKQSNKSNNKLQGNKTKQGNKQVEDLSLNNQIKGFKLPNKAANTQMKKEVKQNIKQNNDNRINKSLDNTNNKISKEQRSQMKSNFQSNSNQNNSKFKQETKPNSDIKPINKNTVKNNKQLSPQMRYSQAHDTSNKAQAGKSIEGLQNKPLLKANNSSSQRQSSIGQRTSSLNDPLKQTIPRESRENERRLKKWRQSELESAERQRRQSKKRESSNASREKKVSRRNDSKFMMKKNQQIDLDVEEEDKFGLFAKKKTTPNKTGSKQRKMKQKLSTQGRQEVSKEDINKHSELSSSQSEIISNENHQNEKQKLMIQNTDLQNFLHQNAIDKSMQKISSIHSSRITQKDEQISQKVTQKQLEANKNDQNLQTLLIATEQIGCLNQMKYLPVEIQLNEQSQLKKENSLLKVSQDNQIIENNKKTQNEQILNSGMIFHNDIEVSGQMQSNHTLEKRQINKQSNQVIPNNILNSIEQPISNNLSEPKQMNNEQRLKQLELKNEQNIDINQKNEHNERKQQQLFEYNLKQLSKFNQSVNQTFNITKYQVFQRDINQYARAPITTFLYAINQNTQHQINSFIPSNIKADLFQDEQLKSSPLQAIVNSAINILLSIDPWIIQRIYQPFLHQNGEVGVWLYHQGLWKISLVNQSKNFRSALFSALQKLINQNSAKAELEDILRLISGVRVAKLKSTKKKVLNQLEYNLKKKHVLKAITAKQSKWGERMFEVVKVQISKQGQNVLKIKQNTEYYWVKEEKFQEIFQHFILIGTRPSHFWTNRQINNKQSHKAVMNIKSQAVTHGSLTLYCECEGKSSISLYKQLDSKVLKYVGGLEDKSSRNGSIYFEFRLHGTYYLFLETPSACNMALQSTTPLTFGSFEHVASHTLKNERCQYVQIEHERHSSTRGGVRHQVALQKLRQKFINMLSNK